MTNTKDVGDTSEAKVLTRLIDLGYEVFTPFGENTRVDLIAEEPDGTLHKIQVKTGRTKQDGRVIDSHLESTYRDSDGAKRKKYTSDEIDVFVIYCQEVDKCYWVEFEEAPSRGIHLRLEAKQDQENIRWAEDYELKNVLQ
jgi:hypothetical protein